jgi:hypothetical protein
MAASPHPIGSERWLRTDWAEVLLQFVLVSGEALGPSITWCPVLFWSGVNLARRGGIRTTMPKQFHCRTSYNTNLITGNERSPLAHLRRKTAFWLFAPVHRANFERQERVRRFLDQLRELGFDPARQGHRPNIGGCDCSGNAKQPNAAGSGRLADGCGDCDVAIRPYQRRLSRSGPKPPRRQHGPGLPTLASAAEGHVANNSMAGVDVGGHRTFPGGPFLLHPSNQ